MRFGATLHEHGTRFRLWAPAARRVELLLHGGGNRVPVPAEAMGGGWWERDHAGIGAGQRYQWRIDGDLVVPDPASRCNPHGPHGPSEVVDPRAFDWADAGSAWAGRPWHEAVFYELHVGTFTAAGTWEAAAARLGELVALGVTAVQLMPAADFPGDFGWGYDGVLPFAPYHAYGPPEALKRFVQQVHRLGLMVFADVVYNHFGPDGNYLHAYAPAFFTQRHRTAWGPAVNFDGEGSAVVREFVVDNALYWLHEFRMDGLRLDAVHAMRDDTRPDILETLSTRVRRECAGRPVHLVLENDGNDGRRLAPPGTPGRYDGQWNSDVHHTLHVLTTGEHDGHYAEYDAPVRQLARCLTHGFARQGGPHDAEDAPPREAATGRVPLSATVNFLQNHDQVGNRAFGERLHALAEGDALRLASAIVLLAPSPPLLFMGEEWGATTPFLFFADWHGDLRTAVQRGREREFAHFPRYAEAAREGRLPDPCSIDTFVRCKLPPVRGASAQAHAWRDHYRLLLQRRRRRLVPLLPSLCADGHGWTVHGAWLEVLWRFDAGERLRMQVNLSAQEVDAVGLGTPAPVDADTWFDLGTVEGERFGPWSGRWRAWHERAP
jgi:malto-oligosyltrehalose trehalohydrolase